MSLHLIDTDWIIDALHGNQNAIDTLLDLASDGLAVSLISYGELFEGAYYARDPHLAMAGLHTFLQGKELILLSPDIMERFAIIRGSLPAQVRKQVGDMDLLIAATALHHNLVLVTRNARHFSYIPSLRLYQLS